MIFESPISHRFHVEEWHRMGEANVFDPENHLELIDGEILDMGPISPNHAGHRMRLTRRFNLLPDLPAIVGINHPIQLSAFSEPHADLALLTPEIHDYTTCHPKAADVLLLIEVSDSTLRFDREQKRLLYATHLIPEYWIVNLIDNCLGIYRQPENGDYREQITLAKTDHINLVSLTEIQVRVADIL
ncbi:Uma2 family endonuclease [Methylomonas koyamae]|uniref:Putative restriction endonuclease domain-containing protein n=1 Tax=Methylomonas koyamae TaxID=702114 RepID=A0AA91I3J4_9GAMM|nr:Uma2 family endonuclease [Methylomonas koyamae]OAI22166.1 hypothetical protein A1356_01855 [Methylomonas koyamae]